MKSDRSGGSEGKIMRKTTLEEVRREPGKKFSIGKEPKKTDSPQYIVSYLSEQFPCLTDRNSVPITGIFTGKVELMPVGTEIWLFDLN
jgi:hypothetical protein